MIRVSGVSKHFDSFEALSSLSMHVRKGTIYGLVGPNGAGKTTIINHINGVMKPECGKITVGGEEIYENEKIKSKILNIADEILLIADGRIKKYGKKEEVLPELLAQTEARGMCSKFYDGGVKNG